jgi:hypothetical protein
VIRLLHFEDVTIKIQVVSFYLISFFLNEDGLMDIRNDAYWIVPLLSHGIELRLIKVDFIIYVLKP